VGSTVVSVQAFGQTASRVRFKSCQWKVINAVGYLIAWNLVNFWLTLIHLDAVIVFCP
jgi:hypothetical protein